MREVHQNGTLPRPDAQPTKSAPSAAIALIVLGILLTIAAIVVVRSFTPAQTYVGELEIDSFGHYNDERVMLRECSAISRLMEPNSIDAPYRFTCPDGKVLTLQVPPQIKAVKALWAPNPGLVVGTISVIPFEEIAAKPREQAEGTTVVVCRAVCWNSDGEMEFLDSFNPSGLLQGTRLLFVWNADSRGIDVGGTFPRAETLQPQPPEKQVVDEAKLREIGLTNAQVIMGPHGYRLTLKRK